MKAARNLFAGTAVVAILAAPLARATLYNFNQVDPTTYAASWSGSQPLPDNNPSGVAFALNFDGSQTITDIRVSLNTSGGWNGDLYAYLSHGSQYAVLLNRVGASGGNPDGSSLSGFDVVLTTGSLNPDIHTATSASGDFTADGRVSYTDTSRPQTLDVFGGADASGGWSLLFADLAPGSVSTLTGWEVDVSVVPEPIVMGLGLFAVVFGVGRLWRWRRQCAFRN